VAEQLYQGVDADVLPALSQFTGYVPFMGYDRVDFRNSGSVDLEVRIEQLRPGKPYLTPDYEFILLRLSIVVGGGVRQYVSGPAPPYSSACLCRKDGGVMQPVNHRRKAATLAPAPAANGFSSDLAAIPRGSDLPGQGPQRRAGRSDTS
jgi:hypothetical protein